MKDKVEEDMKAQSMIIQCMIALKIVRQDNYRMVEELHTRAKSPPVIDLRYKWPMQIFDRVCKCNKECSGFNCMRHRQWKRGARKAGQEPLHFLLSLHRNVIFLYTNVS